MIIYGMFFLHAFQQCMNSIRAINTKLELVLFPTPTNQWYFEMKNEGHVRTKWGENYVELIRSLDMPSSQLPQNFTL